MSNRGRLTNEAILESLLEEEVESLRSSSDEGIFVNFLLLHLVFTSLFLELWHDLESSVCLCVA